MVPSLSVAVDVIRSPWYRFFAMNGVCGEEARASKSKETVSPARVLAQGGEG